MFDSDFRFSKSENEPVLTSPRTTKPKPDHTGNANGTGLSRTRGFWTKRSRFLGGGVGETPHPAEAAARCRVRGVRAVSPKAETRGSRPKNPENRPELEHPQAAGGHPMTPPRSPDSSGVGRESRRFPSGSAPISSGEVYGGEGGSQTEDCAITARTRPSAAHRARANQRACRSSTPLLR